MWNASDDASQALAVACLVLSLGCTPSQEKGEATAEKELDTIDVEWIDLELKPWPDIIRSQGSMFADEQTVVGAQVAGRVEQVHVELGDAVAVGEPMITLDQQEFQLQVIQSEAQLIQARAAVGLSDEDDVADLDPTNAPPVRQEKALWDESKSSLERARRLLDQNAVSQGEYDLALAAERAAEARHASAINSVREKIALIGIREADLAVARQRLQEATIRAPIDGYVRGRQAAPGTFVQVGQPIATVVRTDPLRFRGSVPERYAQSLRAGQEVRLQVVSIVEPLLTKITRVSPALDSESRSLVFEADVPNPDQSLRAGVFAEAEIVVNTSAEALVIPHSALSEFAGVEKVWKIVDGVATEQEVLAGPRRESGREILQGLSAGDRIFLRANKGRVARVADGRSAARGTVGSTLVSPDVASPDKTAPVEAAAGEAAAIKSTGPTRLDAGKDSRG